MFDCSLLLFSLVVWRNGMLILINYKIDLLVFEICMSYMAWLLTIATSLPNDRTTYSWESWLILAGV